MTLSTWSMMGACGGASGSWHPGRSAGGWLKKAVEIGRGVVHVVRVSVRIIMLRYHVAKMSI